jgi:hypothetical protein
MTSNLWKILLLVLCWIIFPPAYIFMIARNKGLTKKRKRWAYGAALLSPISLIILFIAFIFIHDSFFISNKFSRKEMEKVLNITLVKPYNVDYNYIDRIDWQDFTATVIVSFEESSFKAVEQQIIESKYYNLYQDFHGNNTFKWAESDTTLFWEVWDYLYENELTGYWVKEDSLTYKFFEPNLSDAPNSMVLFRQGYIIQGTLSREKLELFFRYIQI